MQFRNLSKLFGLVAISLLLVSCDRHEETSASNALSPATLGEAKSEDQRLAVFFEELFERNVSQNPEFQARLGRKTEDYGSWNDYSEENARFQHQQAKSDLERLQLEFNYAKLNETSQISYRIFEYRQQRSLRNFQWRHHTYAVTQMNDISSQLPAFLQNIHQIETLKDAEDYVSRLAGIEIVMHDIVAQLRLRESKGVIPPMMVYSIVINGSHGMLAGAPFDETANDGILLADFRARVELLEIDEEAQAILLNDAANALSGPFQRGYQALIVELERLMAIADNNHGIWNLPDGEAFYANRIENWTTVTMPVDEIHQLGLLEVDRIRSEMQEIMVEIDFAGDLAEFFEYIRSTSENYFDNTQAGRDAYIREATAIVEGVYDIADDYFNVLPKAPLEVRRVEPWREAGSSTAFYNRAAADGSRPGIYYINQQNMNAVQKHIMNSLAYHEGAPGHHFQIAIQQELEGIPEFRKYGRYSAYTEGWALYAERLAYEAGLYEGLPIRNFGRLAEEMKRAVRLVVDSGMHSMRWSREQCIEYMTNNTPMAPADIVRQIERYFVYPGQALSYKIGMMKILELRQYAKQELGDAYDIRDFHDAVLKNGAVPMQILQEVIEAYVRSFKEASASISTR